MVRRRRPSVPGRIARPRPTSRGVFLFVLGAGVLAAAAALSSMELLFVGLVLVLPPIAALLGVTFARPVLTVSRSLRPHLVAAGGVSDVVLRVGRPAGGRPERLLWRDLVPDALEVQDAEELILAGSSARLGHTVRTSRRGVYQIGPLVVGRYDPFWLAYGEFAVGSVRELTVTPVVTELSGPLADVASSDGIARQTLLRFSPSADELMPRDYRPGDPLRRVHWGATARHGELMVRQEEQRKNPEAWIIFDTSGGGDERGFELAVECVASLGVHLLERGFTLNVIETGVPQLSGQAEQRGGERILVPLFQPPAGDRVLLRGLAEISSVPPDPGARTRLRLLEGLHRTGREAMVVAVLAGGGTSQLAAIAAARSPSKPALAFLTATAGAAREPLHAAGWLCFSLEQGVAAAWDAAFTALSRAEV